jgi:hypothetical protein
MDEEEFKTTIQRDKKYDVNEAEAAIKAGLKLSSRWLGDGKLHNIEEERAALTRIIETYGAKELLRLIGRIMVDEKHCSFCERPRDEVAQMVAVGCGSPYLYICSDCIRVCNDIIADAHQSN